MSTMSERSVNSSCAKKVHIDLKLVKATLLNDHREWCQEILSALHSKYIQSSVTLHHFHKYPNSQNSCLVSPLPLTPTSVYPQHYTQSHQLETQATCLLKRRKRRGTDWEFGISRCQLLHIRWMNSRVLLKSTGSYIQCPVISHNGKEREKECVCKYIPRYVQLIILPYSRN